MTDGKGPEAGRQPWGGAENYWVNPMNYAPEVRQGYRFRDPLIIADVTPEKMDRLEGGRLHSPEEYLEIVGLLEEAGVQETKFLTYTYDGTPKDQSIVAGLRAVGKAGFKLRLTAASKFYHSWTGRFENTWQTGDCQKRLDELADLGVHRVSMGLQPRHFLAAHSPDIPAETSPGYVEALRDYGKAVEYAKKKGLSVDGAGGIHRINPKDYWDLTGVVSMFNDYVECGADRIILAMPRGDLTLEAIQLLVTKLKQGLKKDVPIYCHVHDSFGMATALALAATSVGACPIVSVGGVADRGFASLEEVATALEMLYGVKTGVNLKKLPELTRTVERMTGISMPPFKAVTGEHTNMAYSVGNLALLIRGEKWLDSDGPYDPSVFGRSPSLSIWYQTLHRRVVEAVLERMNLPADEGAVERAYAALWERLDSLGNKFPALLTKADVEEVCREAVNAGREATIR